MRPENIHYNTVDGMGGDHSMSGAQQQIEICVNGERKIVDRELTLHGLLEQLGIRPDRVAIELNKRIVSKHDWTSTSLEPAAQIEIVQFVGGG